MSNFIILTKIDKQKLGEESQDKIQTFVGPLHRDAKHFVTCHLSLHVIVINIKLNIDSCTNHILFPPQLL